MQVKMKTPEMAAAMAREGLNIRQLSELTGLSRSTISAIRNGKNCSPETAQKLAAVLGNQILEKHKYYNNVEGVD